MCTWIQNPDLHLVSPNYISVFTNRHLKQIEAFLLSWVVLIIGQYSVSEADLVYLNRVVVIVKLQWQSNFYSTLGIQVVPWNKVLNFQYLMYCTCCSFIIPGNITVKYLLAITIFSPPQKPLSEIHKLKCSLISLANGTVAAHRSYQQALFWVGIQCPGPHNQSSYLLHSCWAMVNVIVPTA